DGKRHCLGHLVSLAVLLMLLTHIATATTPSQSLLAEASVSAYTVGRSGPFLPRQDKTKQTSNDRLLSASIMHTQPLQTPSLKVFGLKIFVTDLDAAKEFYTRTIGLNCETT